VKTVIYIPGLGAAPGNESAAITTIEQKGYQVVGVQIDWKAPVEDWAAQTLVAYAKFDPEETILAGFSMGAYIAVVAGAMRVPAELWLFSLSPRFAEDFPLPGKSAEIHPRKHLEAFQMIHFARLAPSVTCKTTLVMGSEEATRFPNLARRVREAHEQLPDSRLIVIPDAGHNIAHPAYLDAIASI
jgi:pimeloyl-ACP methyl ester carboxylesterase